MTATVIDAFLVTLGLDNSNFKKNAKETSNELVDLTKKAAAFFAVFLGGQSLAKFIEDTTRSNTQLERLSRNLNVNSSDISAWSAVVQRQGGSADEFGQALNSLSMSLTEIAVTGQSATLPYFRALGVNLADASGKARPLTDIILSTATALQKVAATSGNATAFNIGKMMSFPPALVQAMLQGGDALKRAVEYQRELNPITQQQTKNSEALSNAFYDFNRVLNSIGRSFVNFVTPALTWFFNALTNGARYLEQHKSLLVGLAAVLTYQLLPVLIRAAIAMWALVAPLLLTAAAITLVITALGLLADDWYTWLKGGKSALGDILWQPFADFIHRIENSGEAIYNAIRKAFLNAKDAVFDGIHGTQSKVEGAGSALAAGANAIAKGNFTDVIPAAIRGFTAGASSGRQSEAVQFFMTHGYTKEQASGIAANLFAESQYDPNAVKQNKWRVWHCSMARHAQGRCKSLYESAPGKFGLSQSIAICVARIKHHGKRYKW